MKPPEALVIQVKVKPSAKVSILKEESNGTWVAQVRAPPVDGKANAELIEMVAERFKCRKSSVSIKRGTSGRIKLVRIEAAETP
jgi:uncharacterized protein (TIGR00251 family)